MTGIDSQAASALSLVICGHVFSFCCILLFTLCQDGTPLGPHHYWGVYLAMEKIERDKKRQEKGRRGQLGVLLCELGNACSGRIAGRIAIGCFNVVPSHSLMYMMCPFPCTSWDYMHRVKIQQLHEDKDADLTGGYIMGYERT